VKHSARTENSALLAEVLGQVRHQLHVMGEPSDVLGPFACGMCRQVPGLQGTSTSTATWTLLSRYAWLRSGKGERDGGEGESEGGEEKRVERGRESRWEEEREKGGQRE
jgi:hypothetical protein